DPPVKVLVLEVEDGARILDRADQEALRVLRRRRADAFQAGDVRERRLGILGVERPAREAAARREADDHRHRSSGAPTLLRGDRDELVPGARDEVGELHLRDRAEPHDRSAGAAADDGGLGERCIDDAPRPELLLEAERDLEGAAVDADVLADEEHALVAPHLRAETVRDRLEIGQLWHYLWCGVSRSSGEAKTPFARSAGSGCGDSSARWSESFRSFLTPAPISSSCSSLRSACSRSQLRKRSIGSFSAQRSNMSFGT